MFNPNEEGQGTSEENLNASNEAQAGQGAEEKDVATNEETGEPSTTSTASDASEPSEESKAPVIEDTPEVKAEEPKAQASRKRFVHDGF